MEPNRIIHHYNRYWNGHNVFQVGLVWVSMLHGIKYQQRESPRNGLHEMAETGKRNGCKIMM
jgi:hypothetical protein